MDQTIAQHAVAFMMAQGLLVSRSSARLTSVVVYDRGRMSFSSFLDDEEFVALARPLQQEQADECGMRVSLGPNIGESMPGAADSSRAESARDEKRLSLKTKGGDKQDGTDS